jgi:hypothetical protein
MTSKKHYQVYFGGKTLQINKHYVEIFLITWDSAVRKNI